MGYPVAIENPTTGVKIGIRNGGVKVSNEYEPARDLFLNWLFGSDGALQTLTVNTANNSLIQEVSLINPDARSIVIINGNASPDYAYDLQFSRDGVNNFYTVKTVAAGAKAQIVQEPFPASLGYDLFCRLVITPTVGQAGTQLQFKSYLVGRGG